MRWIPMILLVGLAACATGGARYYDDDHHDYHYWNGAEITFYTRWETETRRPHADWDRRSDDEHREYWNWRHSHDHDDHH